MKLQYILLLSASCTLALTESPVQTAVDAGTKISGKVDAKVTKKTVQLSAATQVKACPPGTHNYNAKCMSNNNTQCKKFDTTPGNYNCAECKWYAWMVKNDDAHATKYTSGKGNWCETRWWLWTIIGVSSLLLLCMLIGVITYCCCGKKKATNEERAPLYTNKQEVEVQQFAPRERIVVEERPQQNVTTTVYRQPVETRYVRGDQYRTYVSSSGAIGEPRVVRYADADYTRTSNTNARYYAN